MKLYWNLFKIFLWKASALILQKIVTNLWQHKQYTKTNRMQHHWRVHACICKITTNYWRGSQLVLWHWCYFFTNALTLSLRPIRNAAGRRTFSWARGRFSDFSTGRPASPLHWELAFTSLEHNVPHCDTKNFIDNTKIID